MTALAWQRAGEPDAPAVVLVHGWASDGIRDWQETGWAPELSRRGHQVLACDLPGHGASADVLIPDDAEPARWTAAAILGDLEEFGIGSVAVVGHRLGGLVAGHVAVRASDRIPRLALIGCDDKVEGGHRAEVAEGLRDPAARVWSAEAVQTIAAARADRRHHLSTLADWVERAAWPAAARLGALRTPALLAVGTADPAREGAPRLARLLHDARLITVPGAGRTALAAAELVSGVADWLEEAAG